MTIYLFTITSDLLTLTVGGEETGHGLKYLFDGDWNTYFQNDTEYEDVTIDIDFGENKNVTYLALGNHNFSDTSTGIKFSYDTNNNGLYSGLTYKIGSSGAFHDYTELDGEIWIESFTQATKRYFRLELESRASLKRSISVLSAGESISVLPFNFGNKRGRIYHNSEQISPGGVIRSISNWGGKKTFNLQFDNLNQANFDYWVEIIDNSSADLFPFFIKDIDDVEYYVRLQNKNINFRKIEHELYSMQISMVQENV